MQVDPERVQAVFALAVAHSIPDERACVLDRECRGDAELRRRVEELLWSHDDTDNFFSDPILDSAKVAGATVIQSPDGGAAKQTADFTLDDTPQPSGESDRSVTLDTRDTPFPLPVTTAIGMRIGPYKLLEKIGEGGMGTVYMAEQEIPVRRRVALKIVKLGMDSEPVIARFEAERQALAMMDHPNIAKVLDAGATATGRPFFVMELVHGVPITEFCDRNQMAPRQRLELFVLVCQAIQHAHQKGIIHRDIKPSNILVTHYDGQPVPKVIDFGIAKATDQRLTDRTMFTQFGSIIGTLEYSSPEQAEMSALGVDTRSDIYSLGVVLYELLTGTTPLEHHKLMGRACSEILHRIRDEEPPKPSTRLRELQDALESISAQRNTEASRLPRLVRGELDWIVMKALEKDRTRRYESASNFARDIQRYLHGDAVEAGPPAAGYRLRKFVRKHSVAMTTVAGFATLLILGATISTWQAILARRAEVRAIAESANARRAEAEAKVVLNFFADRVLAAARPEGQEGGLGKDVTVRRAIDAAEPKIAAAFPDQPIVEASVRSVLGTTYHYLGEPARALSQYERAWKLRQDMLGPDHSDTLSSQNALGLAYQAAGKLDKAIPLLSRTLAARAGTLGREHPDSITSAKNLAMALRDAGQWNEAIELFERTLSVETARLGPDHPDTLLTQNNIALTYRDAGESDWAIKLFEQTLAARAAKLGVEHPDTLLTQNNLAMAYREAGRWDQAISLFERALAAQTARLGPDHPNTLLTQNNLAPAYQAVGQLDRAIALLEQTLAGRTAKLGADHPSTLTTQNNLAVAYQAAGQLDRAIALLEQTLAARIAKLGTDHPSTLTTRADLAIAYNAKGDCSRAESLLRDVLAVRKRKLGALHLDVARSQSALGQNLLRQRKYSEAESLLRESLAIWDAKRPDDWLRFETQSLLGATLLGQKKYSDAEPLLLSGYEGLKARISNVPASSRTRLSEAGERVVHLYEASGKPEKAVEWRMKLNPTAQTKINP
jgi:eukaryotic-like serine/threonine-protein kinase